MSGMMVNYICGQISPDSSDVCHYNISSLKVLVHIEICECGNNAHYFFCKFIFFLQNIVV